MNKTGDYNIQLGITWCWVRAELTLGNHAAVARAIDASPYPARFFCSGHLIRAKIDAWPLARLLIERRLDRWRGGNELVEFVSALTDF